MTLHLAPKNALFMCCAVLPLLLLTSCDLPTRTLRMHLTDFRQFDPQTVQDIFTEQSRVRIEAADVTPGHSALEALVANEADLGLVENSTPFVKGIRAVLPAYESVLHILFRDDFDPSHPQSPLRGASFFVVNQSQAGKRFIELVTRRQELGPGDYSINAHFEADATDIIVYFGPIDPDNTTWARPGYSLVSLDSHLNPRRKFYREGIGYTAPNMKPKTIPALTYDLPGNTDELLTVAVDTLLVTRKDIGEAKIYELTRTLLVQKPRFTAVAPSLFSGINESFDPLDLSFPLHPGARRYLERDEPGLLERYAETINLLVYVIFLMISAFFGFARWRARMKKDRIDVFYERVMAIRDRMGHEDKTQLLAELEALEREAFNSLIGEKLAANDSFRIFTDMMDRLRAEMQG